MKISQMSSDQAADVMIQIAPDIENLVNDDNLIQLVTSREKTSDKEKAKKIGGLFMLKAATYVLKEHRESVWNILGALHQKTAEEIAKQLFPITFGQTIEVLNDKELMSFFRLSVQPEPETASDTSQNPEQ